MTQHPQHSTTRRTPTEPRILRTHRLLTGQSEPLPPKFQDDFVKAAAEGLLSLASKAAARPLHIAPEKRGLHELLSQASQTAKAFTPRRPTLNTEAA